MLRCRWSNPSLKPLPRNGLLRKSINRNGKLPIAFTLCPNKHLDPAHSAYSDDRLLQKFPTVRRALALKNMSIKATLFIIEKERLPCSDIDLHFEQERRGAVDVGCRGIWILNRGICIHMLGGSMPVEHNLISPWRFTAWYGDPLCLGDRLAHGFVCTPVFLGVFCFVRHAWI